MVEWIERASPRTRARSTGAVYLLFFLIAILSAFSMLSTAKEIVAPEASFRLGFALSLISTACYVAVAGLFYRLFKHVSRTLALLAAFFALVGCNGRPLFTIVATMTLRLDVSKSLCPGVIVASRKRPA